jgi:hypothetical protein
MANIEFKKTDYRQLVSQISDTFVFGQQKAVSAVNSYLVETYWKIGQYIVEYEQGGSGKADYGKKLLEQLSKDLSLLHGKGFSLSNIKRMRQFYQTFPIGAEVPHQLSWTHFVELLKIENPLAREKDEYVIEYAMHNISSRLFVSKYQLYLPTKEDLIKVIEKTKEGVR